MEIVSLYDFWPDFCLFKRNYIQLNLVGYFSMAPVLVFKKWPNSRLEKGKLLERVKRKATGLRPVLTGYVRRAARQQNETCQIISPQ